MPAVAVCGVDKISTGHACDATALIQGNLQSKVTIGGNPVAVQGDLIVLHTIKEGSACVPHPGVVINEGSSKVSISGIAMARIGDSADAGAIISGSSNVYAGG
jgi:uncharacterized Zn-binding protein involved in type VI secretion